MCRHSLWGTELCSTLLTGTTARSCIFLFACLAALEKLVFTPLFSLILCLSLSLFFLFSYRVSEWSVRWFVCRLLVWGGWRLFFFSVLSEYTPHHKKKKHTKYLFYFLIYWIELLVESMHAQWFNQMLLKNECWEAAHRLCEGERQTLLYVYVSTAHISRESEKHEGTSVRNCTFRSFFCCCCLILLQKVVYLRATWTRLYMLSKHTNTICLFVFFFLFFLLGRG